MHMSEWVQCMHEVGGRTGGKGCRDILAWQTELERGLWLRKDQSVQG